MKVHVSSRRIWAISLPVIFAGVSESIVEITDILLLGRYGTTELAAIGLADAIYGVCLFLILGLVDGIQITIARRAGQGQEKEIGAVFTQGWYLLGIVAVGFILLLKILLPLIAYHVIRSGDIARAVDDYLQIFAFAMIFHGLNLAFSSFYVGISRTRALIGATIVLATVNISLDLLLIFGHLGFPELGIRGAAIGSLAAEVAAFLYLGIHSLARGHGRRFGLFRFTRWDGVLTGKLMKLSTPVALETLVETLRWFVFFLIIEFLGEVPLACANIVFGCYALLLIPVGGFSETTCSLVSNLVGQGLPERIGGLLRRTVMLGYLLAAPLLAVVLIWPEAVLRIFTSDTLLVAGSVDSLRVVALAVTIVVPADMFFNAVAGTGDTPASLVIEIILSVSILGLAYVFLLGLGWPLATVWLAEAAGWALCLVLSAIWLRGGRWERCRV